MLSPFTQTHTHTTPDTLTNTKLIETLNPRPCRPPRPMPGAGPLQGNQDRRR
jgi:hypothetical protein